MEADWSGVVTTLGYVSEREMLTDFYTKGMSIKDIAKVVGFSSWNVRRRLQSHGIELRARGGPHRAGQSKLAVVSAKELFEEKINELCFKYDVHAATVANERRRRRVEYVALLRNKSGSVTRQVTEPAHTPPSVSTVVDPGPRLSDLLQAESEGPAVGSDNG